MPLQTSLTAAAALAAVVVLILFAGRVAPRLVPRLGLGRVGASSRRMVVREATALDARRRLHLVACDGRELLLLTGGPNDVVVGWLPEGRA